MIESIFTTSPAEIDTEIARLQGQISNYSAMIARNHSAIQEETLPAATRARLLDVIDEASGKRSVLSHLVYALQSEYSRRGGWARYYVVDNNNGHLHTHTSCQNTYDTTAWVWMPLMSGLTKAEAVELGGKLTCLSCFPEFRTEIEKGREPRFETPRMKKTREEREAIAAKKAAEKVTKGITDVDGSPLLDDDGCVIKTLRTAQLKAVDAQEQAELDKIYADQAEDDLAHASQLLEMADREKEYMRRLVRAIAAKQGREEIDVLDEIVTKAEKRLAPARKDEAARKAAGKTAAEWYAAHIH